jgi:hypothetical protein
LRGPQATNINIVSGYAIIHEPVSRLKPAVTAESPAFGSRGVHMREVFERWQFFEYRLTVSKLIKELPNRTSQEDTVFHRFLLRVFFARDSFLASA